VNLHEVVIEKCSATAAKCISSFLENAFVNLLHPHREVGPFDLPRADVLRVGITGNNLRHAADAHGRAVAVLVANVLDHSGAFHRQHWRRRKTVSPGLTRPHLLRLPEAGAMRAAAIRSGAIRAA
jgi:hypothetical protein